MKKKRDWRVRILNVKFQNDLDTKDYFFKFGFGYDFALKRKPLPPKRDKEGKKLPREFENAPTGSLGYEVMTPTKKQVRVSESAEFTSFENTFVWNGSYFDLYDKKLRVEAWESYMTIPNKFLTAEEKLLTACARGAIFQSFELSFEQKVGGRREEVRVGCLMFNLVFQEINQYDLKFQNWGAHIKRAVLDLDTDSPTDFLDAYMVLNLHKPRHFPVGSNSRVVSFTESTQVGRQHCAGVQLECVGVGCAAHR